MNWYVLGTYMCTTPLHKDHKIYVHLGPRRLNAWCCSSSVPPLNSIHLNIYASGGPARFSYSSYRILGAGRDRGEGDLWGGPHVSLGRKSHRQLSGGTIRRLTTCDHMFPGATPSDLIRIAIGAKHVSLQEITRQRDRTNLRLFPHVY